MENASYFMTLVCVFGHDIQFIVPSTDSELVYLNVATERSLFRVRTHSGLRNSRACFVVFPDISRIRSNQSHFL